VDELLSKILEAHGGVERWVKVERLEIDFSIGGALLPLKGISPMQRDMKAIIIPKEQYVSFSPYGAEQGEGIFTGNRVFIQKKGKLLGELENARKETKSKILWNDLNLLYFLGYAIWNYCNTPFYFTWPGISARALSKIVLDDMECVQLEVTYPDGFHTHSTTQIFYYDLQKYLLRRMDYTAEVFNFPANAAHYCYDHKQFNGFTFPTTRDAYARLPGEIIVPFVKAMSGKLRDVLII
jgi:hypothetical protein